MAGREDRDAACTDLRILHEEIERDTAELAGRHRERLRCGSGCTACCVDGITVFEVEADNIRRHHADLLRDGDPHPAGSCPFLDSDGACRIYANRPYVCRTQGLPLRWIEGSPSGQPVELRDICPLNDEGAPLEQLPAEACWTLGPAEGRLAELQRRWGQGRMGRIALRDLFGTVGREKRRRE